MTSSGQWNISRGGMNHFRRKALRNVTCFYCHFFPSAMNSAAPPRRSRSMSLVPRVQSQRWPTVCIYMRNKPLPRFLLRLWDWYHSITRQNCLPRAELRPTWNYYHEYTVTAYCHGYGFITSHIHLHRGRQSIFVELDLNRVVSHQIVQKEVRNWQGICKCYKEVLIIINHEI